MLCSTICEMIVFGCSSSTFGKMFRPVAIVLLLFLGLAIAWEEYEKPIELAKPDTDAIYRFDLRLAEKLTMSTDGENGHVEVLDFEPDDVNRMPWQVRNSDQNTACEAFDSFNSMKNNNLTSLLQLHGLHQVVFAVNGKVPADPIVVPLGAEVILTVHNNFLSAAVTIHVHGLDKRGLWYTDGVAFLQQCPIPPMSSHTYRFIADTPGTHWMHGHLGMDRGHGLLGAFIIKKEEKEEVRMDAEDLNAKIIPAREYAMVIHDWTVASSDYIWFAQRWRTMKWQWGFDVEKLGRCWAPTRTYDFGAIGGIVAMRSLLVNEKGWHDQDDLFDRPEVLPLTMFKIKKGEHVRFRIINGGGANMLMLTIDDHIFHLVAADGRDVYPIKSDMLVIAPGERYDVIIEGLKKPTRREYPIILETMEHYNKTGYKIEPYYGLAKLVYEDIEAKSSDKLNPDFKHHARCNPQAPCLVLNCPFKQFPKEYNFTCKYAIDFKSIYYPGDQDPDLMLTNNTFESKFHEFFINTHWDSHMNGWMYKAPRGIPYYHKQTLDSIAKPCDRTKCPPDSDNRFDDNCFCFFHLEIELGSAVQLTLYNMGYGGGYTNGYAHPFHLHGTHFHLLKMGFPEYNETNFLKQSNQDIDCNHTSHCNEKQWRNSTWLNGQVPQMDTTNPPLRDTVMIPMGGYIVVRFRATNPGWWYAHCHLMLHQMAGMAFAIRVGEHEQMPIPPDGFPNSCGDYVAPALGDDFRSKWDIPNVSF